jgi:hypothetical protein
MWYFPSRSSNAPSHSRVAGWLARSLAPKCNPQRDPHTRPGCIRRYPYTILISSRACSSRHQLIALTATRTGLLCTRRRRHRHRHHEASSGDCSPDGTCGSRTILPKELRVLAVRFSLLFLVRHHNLRCRRHWRRLVRYVCRRYSQGNGQVGGSR